MNLRDVADITFCTFEEWYIKEGTEVVDDLRLRCGIEFNKAIIHNATIKTLERYDDVFKKLSKN